MSDSKFNWLVALVVTIVMLLFYVGIDLWAGHRDMHHIRDLQRRVGELEQKK